ncbi:Trematode Eggshell Synthesis domain containing protein [Schistosoma mansoni]|uniref:Female-specific protein 800 n=1 Tax=Schistosoma mansoni TaxID=6183 RepID=F801_SCHMA|nr:Trematode Eggshell Synthesis domain containing protein [Schistosoma mansoni]P16463.1 RecName: Full=Female-specific protein 800; Short=FS800 [Schistosoma mansoni]AAA29883.1 female-specific 800 protein [Schistosoma mansoni]|eukprot:XP_018645366.1 Trematode Eggshell Synthesis domain containing protein [Schistosoma mansoni]
MKYIHILLVFIILSLFITVIKSNYYDNNNQNQNQYSYHHTYNNNNQGNYQSKNVHSESEQNSYNKETRNNNDDDDDDENFERNKKSIRSRYHGYTYRNDQIQSRGNSAKGGSYSESTYFTLHSGTDRYGRRNDYSRFQTRGRSNGYRENMFLNVFDVVGNIKTTRNKRKITKSEKNGRYIKKDHMNNRDSNTNINEKPEYSKSPVFQGGYRSLEKNFTTNYGNSSNASIPLSGKQSQL